MRAMGWPSKIANIAVLLRTPLRAADKLNEFVEEAIGGRVRLLAAVGPDASSVEVMIDRIIVGDKFDPRRSIPTTAHDTSSDALNLIRSMPGRLRYAEVWI